MIRAWRIVKRRHAEHGLDGEGSRVHGSRWNSPGIRVVHASASLALATLEVLVHLRSPAPLSAYVVFSIDFDASFVQVLDPLDLPSNWRHSPAPPEVRAIGDRWARDRHSVVLQVPSSILPAESNYLINSEHPRFVKLAIGGPAPLDVDARVFGAPTD